MEQLVAFCSHQAGARFVARSLQDSLRYAFTAGLAASRVRCRTRCAAHSLQDSMCRASSAGLDVSPVRCVTRSLCHPFAVSPVRASTGRRWYWSFGVASRSGAARQPVQSGIESSSGAALTGTVSRREPASAPAPLGPEFPAKCPLSVGRQKIMCPLSAR